MKAGVVSSCVCAFWFGASLAAQSAWDRAQKLYAEVQSPAAGSDPALAESKLRERLTEADALCDAAAQESVDAHELMELRRQLANIAFDLQLWAVASALYDDVHFAASSAYGDTHEFTLKIKRLAAASRSEAQGDLPFADHDYEQVLTMQRELAQAWDVRLQADLAATATGEPSSLLDAVYAHRELGLTYQRAKKEEEALQELRRAYDLLVEHVQRLGDPEILRMVCNDHMEMLDLASNERLIQRTTKLLEEHFSTHRDLVLSLRMDLSMNLRIRGQLQKAAELARAIVKDAADVPDGRPEPMAHLFRVAAESLRAAGLPEEAEPLARRSVAILRAAGFSSTNVDMVNNLVAVAHALGAAGRYDEAIAVCDEPLAAGATHALLWATRSWANERAGRLPDAIQDRARALAAVESSAWQLGPHADARRAGSYTHFAILARLHLKEGKVSQALTMLEDLRARVAQNPSEGFPLDAALSHLADARYSIGDFATAHVLSGQDLEAKERRLGPDEFGTLGAKLDLGTHAFFVGRHDEYERLQREILTSLDKQGRQDHPYYLVATVNLAEALAAQQRWNEAEMAAYEGLQRARADAARFSEGNAKAVLGVVALGRAEPAKAVKLLQEGLLRMENDDRNLTAFYRGRLLMALAALEDQEELQAELRALVQDCKGRVEILTALSARERGEIVAGLRRPAELAVALRIARPNPDANRDRRLFEWMATLRATAGPIEAARQHARDPEIARLREAALVARRHLAALTQTEETVLGETASRLLREARDASDAAERALLTELPTGSKFAWLDVDGLSDRLRTLNAVAVMVLRIPALLPHQPHDHYVGFVLDSKSAVRIEDLGSATKIEELVSRWRAAVTIQHRGRPVDAGGKQDDVQELGRQLRAAVLDRLLPPAAGKRVFVCLDDALNTIPWDALPAAEAGKLVGDARRFLLLPSLRDLLDAPLRPARQPAPVLFGDVDYDAPGAVPASPTLADRPATTTEATGGWARLAGSKDELGKIQATLERTRRKPTVVTGKDATKAELFRLAPGATWLHLSTHGYFAPETLPALGDAPRDPSLPGGISGLAPLTLCGLVLAGGNRPSPPMEEVAGIVTAEELAGLDLAACDLAVLSACETSLGARRGGLGLASLQSALHAAGARCAVTSLWQVPDGQTGLLMARFYELIVQQGMSADEALWTVKSAHRKEPLWDWAGWVCSGVPVK